MTDEVMQTVTPAEGESLEQVHQPEITGSEEGTEQAQVNTEQTDTNEQPKKTPWWQSRIDAITREKHEARAEAERYRQQLEALNPQQYDPNQTNQQPLSQAQIDQLVEQRVHERSQQQALAQQQAEFNKACNTAYESGKAEYQDFDEALSTLSMVGLTQPVLDAAVRMDGGHRVLHYLGQNPDVAADLLSLNPVQLGIRMAELKVTVGKSAKPISNAPSPIKPIDGSSRAEPDPDKMTMEEWAAWRAKQAKR